MKKVFLQKGKFLLQLSLPVLLLVSFAWKVNAMTDAEATALSFAKDYLNSVQADLFQKGYLKTATGNSVGDVQAAILASNSGVKPSTKTQNLDLSQNANLLQQDLVQNQQQQMQQQDPLNQPIPTSLTLDDGTTLSQNDLAKIRPPKPNEKSDYVVAIQSLLSDQGFLIGVPTGIFDQTTMDAVKTFQTYKGLKPTGSVDPVTLMSFGQVSKFVAVEKKNNTHVKKQKISMKDNMISSVRNQNNTKQNPVIDNSSALSFARDYLNSIQDALVSKGYLKKATGVIDQDTRSAILKFQTDNNLDPTGSVDSKTGALLLAPISQ